MGVCVVEQKVSNMGRESDIIATIANDVHQVLVNVENSVVEPFS
jgi:hypothetical protein